MKVLFVCQNNVGRSQTAEVFFNRLSQHASTSVGTKVGEAEGQTIADLAQTVPTVARLMELTAADGLPISSNQRNQLTSEMVDAADKVVILAERETWPEYLVEGGKVVFWEIGDAANVSLDGLPGMIDQVKARVEELVREIG